MLIARPWPSYGLGCPYEACSGDGRKANLGPRNSSAVRECLARRRARPTAIGQCELERRLARQWEKGMKGRGRRCSRRCGRQSLVLSCNARSAPRQSREETGGASSRHGDRRERVRSIPASPANRERQPSFDTASPRVVFQECSWTRTGWTCQGWGDGF
jgi:hypothetical protein